MVCVLVIIFAHSWTHGALISWWHHQMETFSALLALCEGNLPVTGGFPSQRPVTQSFDIFFDLRQNKRLSKQSRLRWFETPSRSLWRHCNVNLTTRTTLKFAKAQDRFTQGRQYNAKFRSKVRYCIYISNDHEKVLQNKGPFQFRNVVPESYIKREGK